MPKIQEKEIKLDEMIEYVSRHDPIDGSNNVTNALLDLLTELKVYRESSQAKCERIARLEQRNRELYEKIEQLKENK